MNILVTYDISTTSIAGKKRLQRIAKLMGAYGKRVQNSVFECLIDASQLRQLEKEIQEIINMSEDSVRIYRLGNKWETRISYLGMAKTSYQDTLFA